MTAGKTIEVIIFTRMVVIKNVSTIPFPSLVNFSLENFCAKAIPINAGNTKLNIFSHGSSCNDIPSKAKQVLIAPAKTIDLLRESFNRLSIFNPGV